MSKEIHMKQFDFEELPEIYQIEVTNACQLHCYMCGREFMRREIGFIDPNLIEAMAERNEFASSYMVELQMYGEPTLHPHLGEIIDILHDANVKVGLSHNMVDMRKHFDVLSKLDYLTISLDAYTKETYNKIRRPDDPDIFDTMVRDVIDFLELDNRPFVDLQAVVLPENKHEIDTIEKQFPHYPNSLFRTVEECFDGIRREESRVKHHKLCLNPWLSVSIMWDGTVVPCCFWYDKYQGHTTDKQFTYGNLYNQDLRAIWQGPAVESFRQTHLSNNLVERCSTCIYRSPALLHWRMMMNWLQQEHH